MCVCCDTTKSLAYSLSKSYVCMTIANIHPFLHSLPGDNSFTDVIIEMCSHRLSYTIWYAFLSCHYAFLSIGRHTLSQLHCITLYLQSCIVETAYDTLTDGPYYVSAPHNHTWCQHHYMSYFSTRKTLLPFMFFLQSE